MDTHIHTHTQMTMCIWLTIWQKQKSKNMDYMCISRRVRGGLYMTQGIAPLLKSSFKHTLYFPKLPFTVSPHSWPPHPTWETCLPAVPTHWLTFFLFLLDLPTRNDHDYEPEHLARKSGLGFKVGCCNPHLPWDPAHPHR